MQKTFKVVDPVGLHARPATVAVKAASQFQGNVTIQYNGKSTNMKSIMSVMGLGIPTQAEITVITEGEGDQQALENIENTLRAENIIE